MSNIMENRRKNYFIEKGFQIAFIVKFCLLVIIGSAISSAMIYLYARGTVTTMFVNSRLTITSTADYILPSVLLSSAVVIVVIGCATIAVMLFASHRIAGPLYRVTQDVKDVGAGDLRKRFNLRLSDQVKPLAAGLDAMTTSLRERVALAKSDADGIRDAASAISDPGARARIEAAVMKLSKDLESLRT